MAFRKSFPRSFLQFSDGYFEGSFRYVEMIASDDIRNASFVTCAMNFDSALDSEFSTS